MRLTTVIILASLIQLSAATFAQKVTLNQQNAPLKSIFKEIRRQSGYDFYFDGHLVTNSLKGSVNVTNVSVEEALESLLAKLPLSYKIKDRLVTVTKKEEPSLIDRLTARFRAIDVSGRVIDEQGKGLPGVTVRVKNGKASAITSANGTFLLKGIESGAVIVFTYVGYDAKEVAAKEDLGLVKLHEASSKLDEVVVKPYGITSQRYSTTSISTISAKQIENKPVTNPLLALQGEVPGIEVVQSTGYANSGVQVRIRGISSLTQGNNPFYVVDGVPYTQTLLPALNFIQGSSGTGADGSTIYGNPLSFINPDDIESISVLKDADATAIYGSRAATGAILITTKKGKAGATKVSINLKNGWGSIASKMETLNTDQYLALRREALANSGRSVGATDYDLNGVWDMNRYTDWQKELLGNTAHYSNFNGSISGGSTNTQYLLSTTYNRQTTVFPTDKSDRKGSVHLNLGSSSANQKFHLMLNATYQADLNQLPAGDLVSPAYQLAPNAPALYNADGTLNWQFGPSGNASWNNPLALLRKTSNVQTNNLISNLSLSYELLKNLILKSNFGYNHIEINEKLLTPGTAVAPNPGTTPYRGASFNAGNINQTLIEPQLTYSAASKAGRLDVLLGGTFQRNTNYQQNIFTFGYSSDLLLEQPSVATVNDGTTQANSMYKYAAAYANINYNYQDKYLLTLSGRRDGSSRFGINNQFHDFWSVAGAWVFSNESVLKDNVLLSYGKLRLSYGKTGNDQIADYRFLSLFGGFTTDIAYDGQNGLQPGNLSNPNLQWESTSKLQAGIDLGFFDDRLLLTGNYYRNRSSNQLVSYTLPLLTGYSDILSNFPAIVQNSGWEFDLNVTPVKLNKFTWRSTFNVSANTNKLIAFQGLETSAYRNKYIIGQPVSIIRVFPYIGIDQTTGLYTYRTASGEVTSTPNSNTDRTASVNTLPKFFGGWNNSFSYRSFQLDILFQFAKQLGYNNLAGNFPGRKLNSGLGNQPLSVLNHWPSGSGADEVQKPISLYTGDASIAYGEISSSTFVYSDASYIRLKNVSLSYSLPKSWADKLSLDNCRLFVHAQNLLTITSYKGLDPESQTFAGSSVLPPLRIFTCGVQATIK